MGIVFVYIYRLQRYGNGVFSPCFQCSALRQLFCKPGHTGQISLVCSSRSKWCLLLKILQVLGIVSVDLRTTMADNTVLFRKPMQVIKEVRVCVRVCV